MKDFGLEVRAVNSSVALCHSAERVGKKLHMGNANQMPSCGTQLESYQICFIYECICICSWLFQKQVQGRI